MSLRQQALRLLLIQNPDQKAASTRSLEVPGTESGADAEMAEPRGVPGRPAQPLLVPQSQLEQRAVGSLQGRAAPV